MLQNVLQKVDVVVAIRSNLGEDTKGKGFVESLIDRCPTFYDPKKVVEMDFGSLFLLGKKDEPFVCSNPIKTRMKQGLWQVRLSDLMAKGDCDEMYRVFNHLSIDLINLRESLMQVGNEKHILKSTFFELLSLSEMLYKMNTDSRY